jgi:hypothetical protein
MHQSRPESIGTAYSQGEILIEAADYVFAVTRTLTEPAQTIAPWACARGALETSSLSMWLMDTGINANERVKRSLAFFMRGLTNKRNWHNRLTAKLTHKQSFPEWTN